MFSSLVCLLMNERLSELKHPCEHLKNFSFLSVENWRFFSSVMCADIAIKSLQDLESSHFVRIFTLVT